MDIATEKRGVSRDMVIEATKRIWRFQNSYTDAMASAYRQEAMHQVLEDEAERAALTEALLDGRTITGRAPEQLDGERAGMIGRRNGSR